MSMHMHMHMHMLVIDIEYQGLFMFGLEILNSLGKKKKKKLKICFPQLRFRTAMLVAHFQNHILTWYKTLKCQHW